MLKSCLRIRPANYLCQFSDLYLEAWCRNSRKTQPAKFAVPPCRVTESILNPTAKTIDISKNPSNKVWRYKAKLQNIFIKYSCQFHGSDIIARNINYEKAPSAAPHPLLLHNRLQTFCFNEYIFQKWLKSCWIHFFFRI